MPPQTVAATIDQEFRLEGEAHGQESTVRGYPLAEGLALLTLDLGLARAAQRIGVKLQEF